jgi:hypothetical protein
MKGLFRLSIVALLVLTFGALPLPVAADALCQTQSAAEPLWMTRPSGGGGGVSAQSTCVASCGNGTSVSTLCNGDCGASDINCPSHTGFVTCNGVYTYCSNACPTLPDCETLNGTSCSSPSTTYCSTPDPWTYQCQCFRNHWSCPY